MAKEKLKTTKEDKKTEKTYIETVGRRKSSVARVRLFEDTKNTFLINDKSLEDYFPIEETRMNILNVYLKSGIDKKFFVSAHIKGGGVSGQAEALRHGMARALTKIEPELRQKLKKAGFLKRDPRSKERKKFGLKKARKAPQWSKR